MDEKSDFERFCGNDLKQLKNETDPTKRVHLLRRINLQMYAEACKMNDGFKACRILEDELPQYIRESTPVYEAKMDKIIADLKLDIKPIVLKPRTDVNKILKSKKCPGRCQNDILLEDIQKMLKIDKSDPPKHVSMVIPNPVPNQSQPNEIVFSSDSKFHYNRNSTDRTPSTSYSSIDEPSTSVTAELKTKLPNFHKERCKPSQFGVNTYKSFTSVKRKPEDDVCDVDKRPHLLPSHEAEPQKNIDFVTGHELLQQQYQNKYGNANKNQNNNNNNNNHTGPQNNGAMRRTLGGRRTVNSKFVPPIQNDKNTNCSASNSNENDSLSSAADPILDENLNPRLKNIDPKMIEQIRNEIMSNFSPVDWDRISGLEYAKKIIQEAVILPILRPDIFSGLRRPPKGILLFGPPGTGKTLIGKCIASQSKSTFFCISASSLTSKWIGEGEKMVRALFAVASCYQPAVIFIDEVDSLLCQRSESEHESSRRLKTEFLVQLDGASTTQSERILVVGATNRPHELDDAARRRFVRRLYIPLPDFNARKSILVNLLSTVDNCLRTDEIDQIATSSDGMSGADLENLTQEAVMGPVRCIPLSQIGYFDAKNVRPVDVNDFLTALSCVRASVSPNDLKQYIDWDNTYGMGNGKSN